MPRQAEFITEKFTLHAKSESIKCAILTNRVSPKSREAGDQHIAVFGNGAFGSIHTFGPIVRGYLRAAADASQPAHAVAYFDPWFGSGRYAAAYRAERLGRIARYFAQRQAIHLVGHSWSWPGALAVANDAPESLHTLVGHTPIGHHDTTPAHTLVALARGGLQESRGTTLPIEPEIWPALGAMALAGTGRVLFSRAHREAFEAMEADLTGDVLKALAQGVPIGMTIAEPDVFFGVPQHVQQQLTEAGVIIHELPTTHGGAVTKSAYGGQLYDITRQLMPHASNMQQSAAQTT